VPTCGAEVGARTTWAKGLKSTVTLWWLDIDYYYASRMAGEPPGPDDGGYNDRHFHPAYPRTFRGVLTMKF